MKQKFENVYQFKITLLGTKPVIWRRIQVPESYTFWDLHVAIQDSMGWNDSHLHEFNIVNAKTSEQEKIGLPLDDGMEMVHETLPGWKLGIQGYFSKGNKNALYLYDFGDGWEHSVVLEKILPIEKSVKYPACIAGKWACPPDDVGGVWGYEEFLDAMKNSKHERHEEFSEWIDGEFDPKKFTAAEVRFNDPRKRLKNINKR